MLLEEKSKFKIIWFFLKPYKFQAGVLLVLSLLLGGLEAATVAAVYPILSTALDAALKESVVLSLFLRVAELLPIKDEFITYCTVFLVVALLAFGVRLLNVYYRVRFTADIVKHSQDEVFKKVVDADYQYFIDRKQGELLYNITVAPNRLAGLVTSLTELVSYVILSLFITLFLFSLSWQGTVLVIFLGLMYHYFTRFLGGKVSYPAARGEMEAAKESNVILTEVISGIKEVKVFGSKKNWIIRFAAALINRWKYSVKRRVWEQLPSPILVLFLYLSVGVTAVLIKILFPPHFFHLIPISGTFAFALFKLFPIVGNMGASTMFIAGTLPDCEVVYSILNEQITHIQNGEKEIDSLESDIQFSNVTFAYKDRDKILKGISLSFGKGKTTAIVGRSGSGKSTILNLLLRLFEPEQGEIKVNGVDIKEYKLASWLGKVGFVGQDTFTFNDTVRNNITLHSGNYSEEDVVRTAECADAHSFIIKLPKGYDTFIGDRGVKLSGGQRQKIAVARAMVREPEILIFDEATNALDSISEAAVQEAIDEVSKNRTVIIVAHRLPTVVHADKIVVLGEGEVLEEGTHSELLARKGAYWGLYRDQSL